MVKRFSCFAPLIVGVMATALAAPRDLLLEAEVVHSEVYVQTQAIYRLRLYQGVDVRDLKISGPSARLADFRAIGEERLTEVNRDGRRYRVLERSYAVFPFASGLLTIGGAHADGRIAGTGEKSPDGRRAVRIEVPPDSITVLPIPPGAGVAAKSLSLSETWSSLADGTTRPGDVQRRSLRIEAVGVDAGQLPEIVLSVPGMTVHAEPARLENRFRGELNVASREQTYNLTPLHSGRIVIPELNLRWWNVESRAPATASLPARTLQAVAAEVPLAVAEGLAPTVAPPYLALTLTGLLCLTIGSLWHKRARLHAAWRLQIACRSGKPWVVRDRLLAWVATIDPGYSPRTLGALATDLTDVPARTALGDLDRNLYGPEVTCYDANDLTNIVRQVKRSTVRHAGFRWKTMLPPANGVARTVAERRRTRL